MDQFKTNDKAFFFVTEARANKDGFLELSCQRSSEEVIARMEELTETLLELSTSFKKLTSFKEGYLCVAQFSEDEQWYRTRVIKISGDDVIVKFIDYDNYQEIKKHDLHILPQKFHDIPPQGLTFQLKIEATPKQSCGLFTNLLASSITESFLYKEVELTVTEVGDKIEVLCPAISSYLNNNGFVDNSCTYPYTTYANGYKFKAYVSHCETPKEIYLQAGKYENDLVEVMGAMSEFFAISENQVKLPEVCIGAICACLFSEDEAMYRAQVIDKIGQKCRVKYMDYGNNEIRTVNDLFVLPKQFLELPFQAIKSCLYGLDTLKSMDASDHIVEFAGESEVNAKVVNAEAYKGVLEIDFTNSEGTNLLLHLQNIVGKVEKPKQFFPNKKPEMINKPKLKSVDKLSLKPFKILPNSEEKMIISELDKDGTFHCMSVKKEAELNTQLDDLYELFNHNQKPAEFTKYAVGDFCVAFYEVDGNYYRAKILKLKSTAAFVRYVDYGNASKTTKIFDLPKKFTNLPMQSIDCKLAGNEAGKLLDLIEKVVSIKVMSEENGIYTVTLTRDGKTIGSEPAQIVPEIPSYMTSTQYLSLEPAVGESYDIKVCNVVDFDDISCTLMKNQSVITDLTKQVLEIYSAAPKSHSGIQLENVVKGGLCVVKCIKDGLFYRGQIVDCSNTNEVEVCLVDVGQTIAVKKKYLKIISPDLKKYPRQAIKIRIQAENASDELCKHLALVLLNNQFNAVFKSFDKSTEAYSVKLTNRENNVVDQKYIMKSFQRMSEISSKKQSVLRYVHLDDMQIQPIEIGVDYNVKISFVENVECIWINLVSHKKAFENMTEELNSFYNNLSGNKLVPKDAFPGLMCTTCVGNDWIRASVICSYNDVVELKSVDTGLEVTVNISDIRCLKYDFSSLPSQAIRCSLHNIKPAQLRWSQDSLRFLCKRLSHQSATCQFITKSETVNEVNIVLPDSKEILQTELIAQNLADWKDASIPLTSPNSQRNIVKDPNKSKLYFQHHGVGLIGVEVIVEIAERRSPEEFFVLPINRNMRHLLHFQVYNEDSEAIDFEDLYSGKPCIYINKNKQCIRAAIVKETNNELIRICLVDFGRHENVQRSSLKKIKVEHVIGMGHVSAPTALRCTLNGVVLPTTEDKKWSPNSKAIFESFIQSSAEIKCSFHGCATNGVNQLFVVKLSNPVVELTNELLEQSKDARLAKFIGEVTPLKPKSFFSSISLKLGEESKFIVTHVERADLFYCQLSKNLEKFNLFFSQIQKFAKTATCGVNSWPELAQRPMCLAKDQNGFWYRAHFIAPLSNNADIVKVILVDHGNSVNVHLHQIIKLGNETEFLKVPIQAISCFLFGHENITKTADHCALFIAQLRDITHSKTFNGIVSACSNGKVGLDLLHGNIKVLDTIKRNLQITNKSPQKVITAKTDTQPLNPMPIKSNSPIFLPCKILSKTENFYYCRPTMYEFSFTDCSLAVDRLYTGLRDCDHVVNDPDFGDSVAVKHPTLESWCRATILEAHKTKSGCEVVLELVDVGGIVTVKLENIRQLSRNLLDWHRLCCKINTSHTLNVFEDHLMRFIICNEDIWDVEIKNLPNKTQKVEEKPAPQSAKATNMQIPMSINPSVPEKTSPPALKISKSDNKLPIFISHVCNDKSFYAQLVDKADDLTNFMEEYKSSNPTTIANIAPGVFCSASYLDDGYIYRAKVLQKTQSECEVFYLDYGNTCSVVLSDIKELPQAFTKFPQQAFHCKIKTQSSNDEVFKTLDDLTASERLSIQVLEVNPDHIVVDIFEIRNNKNVKIFESQVETAKAPSKVKVEPPSPKVDSIFDVPLYSTKDSVIVCYIENLDNFWLQLSENAELDAIQNEIATWCEQSGNKMNEYKSGNVCCALFHEDEAWYRALILSVNESEKNCEVLFIDYGNTEVVEFSNLRKASEHLAASKANCVNCSLAGLKFSPKTLPKDLLAELYEFLQEIETLRCELAEPIESENKWKTFSVRLRYDNNITINDWYVSKGGSLMEEPVVKAVHPETNQKAESSAIEEKVKDSTENVIKIVPDINNNVGIKPDTCEVAKVIMLREIESGSFISVDLLRSNEQVVKCKCDIAEWEIKSIEEYLTQKLLNGLQVVSHFKAPCNDNSWLVDLYWIGDNIWQKDLKIPEVILTSNSGTVSALPEVSIMESIKDLITELDKKMHALKLSCDSAHDVLKAQQLVYEMGCKFEMKHPALLTGPNKENLFYASIDTADSTSKLSCASDDVFSDGLQKYKVVTYAEPTPNPVIPKAQNCEFTIYCSQEDTLGESTIASEATIENEARALCNVSEESKDLVKEFIANVIDKSLQDLTKEMENQDPNMKEEENSSVSSENPIVESLTETSESDVAVKSVTDELSTDIKDSVTKSDSTAVEEIHTNECAGVSESFSPDDHDTIESEDSKCTCPELSPMQGDSETADLDSQDLEKMALVVVTHVMTKAVNQLVHENCPVTPEEIESIDTSIDIQEVSDEADNLNDTVVMKDDQAYDELPVNTQTHEVDELVTTEITKGVLEVDLLETIDQQETESKNVGEEDIMESRSGESMEAEDETVVPENQTTCVEDMKIVQESQVQNELDNDAAKGDGPWLKGNCRKLPIGENGDSDVTLKIKEESLLEELRLPHRNLNAGDTVNLEYVKHKGLDYVYFRICNDKISSDLEKTLETRQGQIKKVITPDHLKESMLCLVQSSDDETWHRGMVCSKVSPTEIIVGLIDYGLTLPKPVNISCLRMIPDELCQFPPSVIKCKVNGLDMEKILVESGQSNILKSLCFGYSITGTVDSVEIENFDQVFSMTLTRHEDSLNINEAIISTFS